MQSLHTHRESYVRRDSSLRHAELRMHMSVVTHMDLILLLYYIRRYISDQCIGNKAF